MIPASEKHKLTFFENNFEKIGALFAQQAEMFPHLASKYIGEHSFNPRDYELIHIINPELSVDMAVNEVHALDFGYLKEIALGDRSFEHRISFTKLPNNKVAESVTAELLPILKGNIDGETTDRVNKVKGLLYKFGLSANVLLNLSKEDLIRYVEEIEKVRPEIVGSERYIFINKKDNSKSFALDHTQHLAYLLHFAFSAYLVSKEEVQDKGKQ